MPSRGGTGVLGRPGASHLAFPSQWLPCWRVAQRVQETGSHQAIKGHALQPTNLANDPTKTNRQQTNNRQVGGLLGSSALTTYVESASAVREGGRTGELVTVIKLQQHMASS